MGLELPQPDSNLSAFLEFLYGGLEGYAYVATKNPENVTDWGQQFFQYPAEADRMESVILQKREQLEVYVSPVLFKSASALKENFSASNVVWTEFDGNAPDEYEIEPTLRVQSSLVENQHVYWRLADPVSDVTVLESINRSITYALGADSSAWDANQVLRPPNTFNHKRQAPVSVIHFDDTAYDLSVFDVLPKVPEGPDPVKWELGSLPNAEDVVLRYAFPPDLVALLKKEKSEVSDGSGQRAKSLVNLAYGCAEMGMTDAEMFVMLRFADDRWEKFTHRKDRNKRLAHIITVARHKYPSELYGPKDSEEDAGDEDWAFGFKSFLNAEINVNWIIEPMLMEQGTMLMVGPSGIGKTQLTLQLMIHMALGKDYMHYKIEKPSRVMFLSLEMDAGSLKKFLESMAKSLTEAEIDTLEENFLVVPTGEPWALNLPVGQERLLKWVKDFQPDGIFIDSIGSAIKGSLSKDEDVQGLLIFNDQLKKKYECFTWYIHHMRKSTNGGHAPSTQDDIYGNQYLLNRASSSYGVLRGRDGLIKIRNFKNRLAPMEEDFYVQRNDNLTFEKLDQPTAGGPVILQYKPEDKGPTSPGGIPL